MDSCNKCAFAYELLDDYYNKKNAECRRFPPVVDDSKTKFPVVELYHWCGEFKTKFPSQGPER